MKAQKLRHRITVQRKVIGVDPVTNYRTTTWPDRIVDEPAEYLPGPGREYLASDALRAQVTGRFFMRWSPAVMAIEHGDRVLWDGRVMSVKSPPMVDATARRQVILMVADDETDGS